MNHEQTVEEAANNLEAAYEMAEHEAKAAYDAIMLAHQRYIIECREDLAEAHRRETIERVMREVEKRFGRGV